MMIFYNTISSYHNPHAIIIFAFSLQNITFLQNRQIALDGALAHRQDLRHFFPVIVGDSLIRRSIFC